MNNNITESGFDTIREYLNKEFPEAEITGPYIRSLNPMWDIVEEKKLYCELSISRDFLDDTSEEEVVKKMESWGFREKLRKHPHHTAIVTSSDLNFKLRTSQQTIPDKGLN